MGGGDRYESDYMDAEGALFLEKHVSRVFAALMALGAVASLAVGATMLVDPQIPALTAAAPVLGGALTAATGLYFAVMRVSVTAKHVRVQYGTLGPTIPVEAIESCDVVSLGLSRFFFGPKIWPEGWRYVAPGAEDGVRVTWRTPGGLKTCTIGARDAPGLKRAIETARGSAPVFVRADVARDDRAEEAAAEAEEVEAEEEEELEAWR